MTLLLNTDKNTTRSVLWQNEEDETGPEQPHRSASHLERRRRLISCGRRVLTLCWALNGQEQPDTIHVQVCELSPHNYSLPYVKVTRPNTKDSDRFLDCFQVTRKGGDTGTTVFVIIRRSWRVVPVNTCRLHRGRHTGTWRRACVCVWGSPCKREGSRIRWTKHLFFPGNYGFSQTLNFRFV
jgi:hypothetical protein